MDNQMDQTLIDYFDRKHDNGPKHDSFSDLPKNI